MSNNTDQKTDAPKFEIASDTVKTQLAGLTLDNVEMQKSITTLAEENKQLKAQNIELAAVIENQLKADKIIRIQAASKYNRDELEKLSIEQLQSVEETLTHTLGYSPNYKSIRAGNASQTPSRLTVGDLYGKSPKEIAAMEGF